VRCLVVAEGVMLAVGGQDAVTTFAVTIEALPYLLSWMAIDVVLAAALAVLWWRAVRERYGLRYLNPVAFRTLVALAEVLVHGEKEDVPHEEVARNVDRYLASLEARGKRNVQLALTVMGLAQYAAARITGTAPRIVKQAPLPPGTIPAQRSERSESSRL
jgi:hypothetical protein